MTESVHLPAVIDFYGMDPIIAAVRHAFARKPVVMKPRIDRKMLEADSKKAIVLYLSLLATQKGAWNARYKRGQRLLRAICMAEIMTLLRQDEAGQWWEGELARIDDSVDTPGDFYAPVRRVLSERFTTKGGPRSAWAALGKGSALEWLIHPRSADIPMEEGHGLATVFERHFGIKPKKISVNCYPAADGSDRWYIQGAFFSFVAAVLTANGIKVSAKTIALTFNRRRPSR